MEIETGIDLVEVERIERSLRNPRFVERVYTPAEQELLRAHKRNAQTAAVNFAAKEAFSKAMGTGFRGFGLTDVALLRDSLGKPYFVLSGYARELVEQRGYTLSVSLTHTRQYAAAVVVAHREETDCVHTMEPDEK